MNHDLLNVIGPYFAPLTTALPVGATGSYPGKTKIEEEKKKEKKKRKEKKRRRKPKIKLIDSYSLMRLHFPGPDRWNECYGWDTDMAFLLNAQSLQGVDASSLRSASFVLFSPKQSAFVLIVWKALSHLDVDTTAL